MFASVIINITSSSTDYMYEYLVPLELEEILEVGERVSVAFGPSNRKVMGFVLEIYDLKRFEGETKPIIEILDLVPVISKKQLELAYYLKNDTICPLIRVLNLMIPDALNLKTFKYLEVDNPLVLDADLIDLFGSQRIVPFSKQLTPYKSKINREIKKGHLKVTYETKGITNFKYLTKYQINLDKYYQELNTLKNETKRNFLTEYLKSDNLTKNEIIDKYDISEYMLTDLTMKGFLKKIKERIYRIDVEKDHYSPYKKIISKEIEKTIDAILKSNEKPVLYVPSSYNEKELVLIKLVENTFLSGKKAIIICSDILSSVKYASVIRKNLGLNVACINSNLTSGEYLDYYTEIVANKYQVIVTTPKGMFLPYQNVGMYFMMDEESDNYYNDQSPRYDLKEVCKYLRGIDECLLVMESISPSVSSYCYGLKDYYNLIDNSVVTFNPDVEVIDMKNELRCGNNTYLSKRLERALIETKRNGYQSLLIVNNKTYSNYVICRACGYVAKCPSCEVSLQYSEKKNLLVCPCCGYKEPFLNKCNSCGSKELFFGGVGIENIVDLISEKIPDAKMLVIDSPAMGAFNDAMLQIENQNCDIIITTETYAKALIDTYIQTVGIINLDSTLKTPAYDANSRTYNLLCFSGKHVSNNGKLYVQTTQIDSPCLINYIKGDYHAFLKTEIANRKLMHNEPFYKVNRIIIKTSFEEMFHISNSIKKTIREIMGNKVFIIGPTYSKRFQGCILIIKHNSNEINDVYKKIYEHYKSDTAIIIFDKYPRKL